MPNPYHVHAYTSCDAVVFVHDRQYLYPSTVFAFSMLSTAALQLISDEV